MMLMMMMMVMMIMMMMLSEGDTHRQGCESGQVQDSALSGAEGSCNEGRVRPRVSAPSQEPLCLRHNATANQQQFIAIFFSIFLLYCFANSFFSFFF